MLQLELDVPHMPTFSSEPTWDYTNTYYLVCGGVAGMIEHGSMFPVDTLKTRLQAAPSQRGSSLMGVTRAITQHGGVLALYRGVMPGMSGAFPSHAAYFAIYENVKRFLGGDSESMLHYAVAGGCATVGHDCFHTPFDVLKQRMQISNAQYGVASMIRSILRTEGFGAFYASVPTTIAMNVPFAAVHFTTYETCKKFLGVSDEELENSFWKYTVAGGLGGALGGLVSNPFDVVKTRQQLGLAGRNVFRAFVSGYRHEGLQLFTRGATARVLYFAPSAAISMTSYEMAKWVLSATRFASLFRTDKPRTSPPPRH